MKRIRVCGAHAEADAPTGLADIVDTCTEIIGSAISERVLLLGGRERDIDEIAQSAAFALLAWSAGRALGG